MNSDRWSTIKNVSFIDPGSMSGPTSRVMPSWICSSWFYFEGSSNLHGSRWLCCESQTRDWLGRSTRVTSCIGVFPVTSSGQRMRHVVLVYLQWQVMGLAALWRNGARCAENRFTGRLDLDWTTGCDGCLFGFLLLMAEKSPNSCRSE